MSKTNNNLILIFGILTFIFGLLSASPIKIKAAGRGEISNIPYYYFNPEPFYYTNPKPINYNNQTTLTKNNPSLTNTSNTTTQNYNTTDSTSTIVSRTTDVNDIVATNNTNESYGSLTASALAGSNSFMPTGLLQWIILIIIIAAIIFLWRYVYAEEVYLSEPLKHA